MSQAFNRSLVRSRDKGTYIMNLKKLAIFIMLTMLLCTSTGCTKEEVVSKGVNIGHDILNANSKHLGDLIDKTGQSIINNGEAPAESTETDEIGEEETDFWKDLIDGIIKALDNKQE